MGDPYKFYDEDLSLTRLRSAPYSYLPARLSSLSFAARSLFGKSAHEHRFRVSILVLCSICTYASSSIGVIPSTSVCFTQYPTTSLDRYPYTIATCTAPVRVGATFNPEPISLEVIRSRTWAKDGEHLAFRLHLKPGALRPLDRS